MEIISFSFLLKSKVTIYTLLYNSEPVQGYICVYTRMAVKSIIFYIFNGGIALQRQKYLGKS